jgi:acyl carrier protein
MGHDIEKEIITMLSTMTGFEPDEIKLETNIVKDLGVDSLKIIEIASAIDLKYKVVVEESHLVKIRTVGQTIALVKELLEKKQKES